jgi:hypothetical protein
MKCILLLVYGFHPTKTEIQASPVNFGSLDHIPHSCANMTRSFQILQTGQDISVPSNLAKSQAVPKVAFSFAQHRSIIPLEVGSGDQTFV